MLNEMSCTVFYILEHGCLYLLICNNTVNIYENSCRQQISVGLYTNVFRIVVKAMLLQRDSDNIKRAVMIVSKNYCQHLTII